MGMFSTIEDELFCPFCGEKNDNFQTKGLSCLCDWWTIEDIKKFVAWKEEIKIYTQCKKCKKRIELIIKGEDKSPNI